MAPVVDIEVALALDVRLCIDVGTDEVIVDRDDTEVDEVVVVITGTAGITGTTDVFIEVDEEVVIEEAEEVEDDEDDEEIVDTGTESVVEVELLLP